MNNAAHALLLLLCAMPAAGQAFSSRAKGTTTAGFLELGAGARAESLGGAFAAAAEGADALYWNPAGLGALRGGEATLMHAPYLGASSYDYAAAAQRVGPGAVAAGAQYFSAGSVEQTDASGVSLGGTTPYDLAVSAGYGVEAGPDGPLHGLAAGAAAKLIRSRLATTAQAAAVDLGLLSPRLLASKRLRLGLTARNLGGTMKFDSAREMLPLVLSAGAALQVEKNWLLLAQTAFPRSGDPELSAGAEYRWKAASDLTLSGRGGLNSRTLGEVSGLAGVTLGGGFAFRTFSFDYALVPLGDLGVTHRLSMSLRWGGLEDNPLAPPRRRRVRKGAFEEYEFAARGFQSVKQYAKAADSWREAERSVDDRDPRLALALVQRGENLARAGENGEAEDVFRRAVGMLDKLSGVPEMTQAAAHVGLAERLAAAGDPQGAQRHFKAAMACVSDETLRGRIKARAAAVKAGSR